MGGIRNGEETTFDVVPGRHRFHLRIDWCRSRKVELNLAPGEEVHLNCHARSAWLVLFWATLGRSRYVALQVFPGDGTTASLQT